MRNLFFQILVEIYTSVLSEFELLCLLIDRVRTINIYLDTTNKSNVMNYNYTNHFVAA